jgi:hypothetical protein
LRDWIGAPREMGRYRLFRNNCARLLTRYLGRAGLTPDLHEVVFPVNIPPYLRKVLVNPYPPLVVPTLRSVLPKIAREGGARFSSLTDLERLRYVLESRDIPVEVLDELSAALPAVPNAVEAYGLGPLPEALYQACTDPRCAEEVARAGTAVWSADAFRSSVVSQAGERAALETRIRDSDLTEESVRHYRLLSRVLEN